MMGPSDVVDSLYQAMCLKCSHRENCNPLGVDDEQGFEQMARCASVVTPNYPGEGDYIPFDWDGYEGEEEFDEDIEEIDDVLNANAAPKHGQL